jgi:hypothetical protein
LNRALAFLALAGIAASPLRSNAQDLPEEFREDALVVRVHAFVSVPEGAPGSKAAWQEENVKYTVPGVPVGVKLVGTNIVVMTQVTPFVRGDGALTLVAQGQVWVRSLSGGLSYRTTLDTVSVAYGETVFFYPLGVDPEGHAPLRIEISVNRRDKDTPAPSGALPAAGSLAGDAAQTKR